MFSVSFLQNEALNKQLAAIISHIVFLVFETTTREWSKAVNCVKLQSHKFHFNFPSTSPDKVWMWHEMRYRRRANWYLINVRPYWRAQAHLLHVSSNMHDLQAGFSPQQTFHTIRSINVRWCTQAAYRRSKYSVETLPKSWQMAVGVYHQAGYLNSDTGGSERTQFK